MNSLIFVPLFSQWNHSMKPNWRPFEAWWGTWNFFKEIICSRNKLEHYFPYIIHSCSEQSCVVGPPKCFSSDLRRQKLYLLGWDWKNYCYSNIKPIWNPHTPRILNSQGASTWTRSLHWDNILHSWKTTVGSFTSH